MSDQKIDPSRTNDADTTELNEGDLEKVAGGAVRNARPIPVPPSDPEDGSEFR